MARHALLLETAQGATIAVLFDSAEAARDWEDQNPDVVSVGLAAVVNRPTALNLA
jgi:hypothetical protein